MAAEEVRRFGLPPKVAFLSHSNYGSSKRAVGARCARRATCFAAMAPRHRMRRRTAG
jgi:malate dehydrogenase (oxaloacetate-decarboxylating)(NADP+)